MPPNVYNDDLEAAHARIRQLEQDNQRLESEQAGGTPPSIAPRVNTFKRAALLLVVLLGVLAVAGIVFLGSIAGPRVAAVAVVTLVTLVAPMILTLRLIHTCGPGEALIVSGRSFRGTDGMVRGYRVVLGGRVVRLPFLERVERFDLGLVPLELQITTAYTTGGLPVDLEATAAVRVGRGELLHNAVERFLNRDREELARVARETLEGNLRGILATVTLEELQENRLVFTEHLKNEAEDDLVKIGLVLEVFELQDVRLSV